MPLASYVKFFKTPRLIVVFVVWEIFCHANIISFGERFLPLIGSVSRIVYIFTFVLGISLRAYVRMIVLCDRAYTG